MTELYKLVYFNLKALGEPIRFIFANAGVNYEDVRITHEDWATTKNNYPYGQLPVLQVGNKTLAQSNAICRFLGKKFALHGNGDWEAACIDEIADTIADFRRGISKIMTKFTWKKIKPKSHSFRENFVNSVIPTYYSNFEARIAMNSQSLFLVGETVSWADLLMTHCMEIFEILFPESPNMLAAYPNLQKLRNLILNMPQIKEWVEKRPRTSF